MKATLEIVGYIGDADTIIAIGFFVISRRERWQRLMTYVRRQILLAQVALLLIHRAEGKIA